MTDGVFGLTNPWIDGVIRLLMIVGLMTIVAMGLIYIERKVLGRFTVDDTVKFFTQAGVDLKREDTGKLFPVTDSARTVLDALLREATGGGAELMHPARV